MENRKLTIMCVGAHNFDMIKGPGGTLIKFAKAGHRVVPVVVADSFGYGELPLSTPPKEVPEIQREECRKASRFVKFDEPRFLGYTTVELMNLQNDLGAITKIMDLMREVRPNIVFTHWPGDECAGSFNHGNTGILATKAVKLASQSEYKSGLPALETNLLLYFMSEEFTLGQLTWGPDIFIDITDEIQRVHQCMRIFRAHTGDPCPSLLREYRLVPRRFWGVISGAVYAEAFKMPQSIGAKIAYNWFPDNWVSTGGHSILSHETNPELGTFAHPQVSIPADWPENSPVTELN
jgi:LmbE family N-acetylglucosaminyl deacetylase